MNDCVSCRGNAEDVPYLETDHWRAMVAYEQSYLGRSVVVLKSHKPSLSDLSSEEWIDLSFVVRDVESAIKETFGATMFNWGCLMNDAYKLPVPNPHVHWHVRPRYDHPVERFGTVFTDPEFGHHYSRERKEIADAALLKRIHDEIAGYFC